MHTYTNRLVHETSPYLLQHAHNPVDWYPWGPEALERARNENKPILVSIGYAACHWCHVMERESFEDPETAGQMNRDFINIKIDREERPDLDHIYMDAVQAMTGSGGWPLNVFLTPEAKPFYGGTYFPPQRAYNRPSWRETLASVAKAFEEKRHEIDAQADNLTAHLVNANAFGMQQNPGDDIFQAETTVGAFQQLMQQADREWGGFGKAPKFPQTFSIQYLLRYHWLTGNPDALQQALLSLDKMIDGGIYDQVGGGFARYSTDTEWLAPHFEKMLYDNALLLGVLSEAWQLTRKESYREVIEQTMDFITREMTHPEGGFYAALDADSEGMEGKYYVWQKPEIEAILGEDAALFCAFYDITENGNWTEVHHQVRTNILRVKTAGEVFARERGMDPAALKAKLQAGKALVLEARSKRVRPLLDDKIILGWNALMNTALSKVYMATGREAYRQLALRNMEFLLRVFRDEQGYYHTWKAGQARYPAFLDDLAFLVEALLNLQEITAETKWLDQAAELTRHILARFAEPGTGFFFYTAEGQADVIVRKKEVYDGAVPSGNAVMARNLHRLGILLDVPEWRQQAMDMVAALGRAVSRYPGSFGYWACLLQEQVSGTNEIAVLGPGFQELMKEIYPAYIPHRVLMGAASSLDHYPLLANKTVVSTGSIQLCRNYTCQRPVFSAKELISLINKDKNE